jgi:predicted dehydrogenase
MESGKDVFLDKAPVISLEQLEAVRRTSLKTGRKLFVYYSEFVSVEASIFAKQLIDRGVIGDVFHMDIYAPHRLDPDTRPEWFFKRERTGGIIIDIGSHQLQQFLAFSGATDARVESARVNNYFFESYAPDGGFDDFGDLTITANNGVTGYIRIDWNSPRGIGTWGDVRAVIEGSRGYIELRKNCDIGREKISNTVLVCTDDGVFTESVSGKVGIEYYSNVIADCINRTDTAMPTWQAYRAIELAIEAQTIALANKK